MNFLRCLPFALLAGMVLPLASCDKAKELVGKAKGWMGGDDAEGESESAATEVITVTEEEGKKIIADEDRMVVVEFYSDT